MNEFTNSLNNLYNEERTLLEKIDETEQDVNIKLAEMHELLGKYYKANKQTGAILLSLDEFTTRVKETMLHTNMETIHAKKREILDIIENISWSASKLTDLLKDVEHALNKTDE